MNKLKYKVGDTAIYNGNVVKIVSRVIYKSDLPYRIEFSNKQQMQVTEESLRNIDDES